MVCKPDDPLFSFTCKNSIIRELQTTTCRGHESVFRPSFQTKTSAVFVRFCLLFRPELKLCNPVAQGVDTALRSHMLATWYATPRATAQHYGISGAKRTPRNRHALNLPFSPSVSLTHAPVTASRKRTAAALVASLGAMRTSSSAAGITSPRRTLRASTAPRATTTQSGTALLMSCSTQYGEIVQSGLSGGVVVHSWPTGANGSK